VTRASLVDSTSIDRKLFAEQLHINNVIIRKYLTPNRFTRYKVAAMTRGQEYQSVALITLQTAKHGGEGHCWTFL